MKPLKEIIPIGATGSQSVRVRPEHTVGHVHPGMPNVYSTPMMIFHMEDAAADAIHEFLPDGWASVGVHIDVAHLAPTPVGKTVTATATVIAVDTATVTFRVEAHDETEKIGEGTHVRTPIELARFERRVRAKAEAEPGG